MLGEMAPGILLSCFGLLFVFLGVWMSAVSLVMAQNSTTRAASPDVAKLHGQPLPPSRDYDVIESEPGKPDRVVEFGPWTLHDALDLAERLNDDVDEWHPVDEAHGRPRDRRSYAVLRRDTPPTITTETLRGDPTGPTGGSVVTGTGLWYPGVTGTLGTSTYGSSSPVTIHPGNVEESELPLGRHSPRIAPK